MAKIKFGLVVTDARGKLGGHVFSKNKAGNYLRTKVTPVNPKSSAQSEVRNRFAEISQAWSGLSDSERGSFVSKVSSYSKTDIFGDLKNPTGKALYQRLNQNLGNSGQDFIDVCPHPIAVPNVGAVSQGLGTDIDLIVETTEDSTPAKVLYFATSVVSDGTTSAGSKLRLIQIEDGAPQLSVSITASYIAKFGTPVTGDKLFVGVKTINSQGQASPLSVVPFVTA